MRARRLGLHIATACAVLALGLARVPDALATRDAPPPAHSGGFGEPTCTACHMQAEANTGRGEIVVEGVPATYEAGRTYALTIAVSHPGLKGGGFQLTARFEDGTQAGGFRMADGEATRTGVMTADGVEYAHHLGDGTLPTSTDSVTWTVAWTAPMKANGRVLFHAAVNASNDDLSPFGDYVYTRELVSVAGPPPAAGLPAGNTTPRRSPGA